CASSLYW
nr:immunoglobulin heavy chain junction region [Mus musculus]